MRSGFANQELFYRLCEAASVLSSRRMGKKDQLSKYLAELGRKGGKARVKRQTPEQRRESARKAAQARWEQTKGQHSGET